MALLGHNGAVSPSVVAPSGPVGQAVPATYRYDLAAVPRANSRSADDHAASGDSVALRKEIGVALRIIAGIGVTVAALALARWRAWWLYRAGRAAQPARPRERLPGGASRWQGRPVFWPINRLYDRITQCDRGPSMPRLDAGPIRCCAPLVMNPERHSRQIGPSRTACPQPGGDVHGDARTSAVTAPIGPACSSWARHSATGSNC
jgi:hypothetical protein